MANNTNTINLPPGASVELGGSGTYFFKGYITAEEYSIDLQGKYGLQIYDVMRKSDATIHAALNVCKQPIMGADWKIEAASNDPLDQQIADEANEEFFGNVEGGINYHEIQREGLTYLDMGFFIAEKVWGVKYRQGKPYIGLVSLNSRKQRSILKWELDTAVNGSLDGVTQILPTGKYVNIPRSKLLVVVNDQEGENYYGNSLLRYAYKPWKIKDGLEIMNAVALENQGMGILYMKKGIDNQTIDAKELDKLRERLRQQRVNEEAYLEFPASVEVGYLNMQGNTVRDVLPTIQYQDRQILLSVLAQFLLLGQADAAGSRAVSQDHSRLFVKSLEAVAKQWQIAFQRDVVNQWVDLNYSNLPNGYPKLVFSTISDEDVTETATAVNQLMTVHAINPDRDIENRLRTMLNLPELSDEDYDNYSGFVGGSTIDSGAVKQVSDDAKAGAKNEDEKALHPNVGFGGGGDAGSELALSVADEKEIGEAVMLAQEAQRKLLSSYSKV